MTDMRRARVIEALYSVDTGTAGHAPTVALTLADEVRRLTAENARLTAFLDRLTALVGDYAGEPLPVETESGRAAEATGYTAKTAQPGPSTGIPYSHEIGPCWWCGT